jgi:nitrogen regulatory protein PII
MKFIITYTDYKYQRIYNLNVNHIFNQKYIDASGTKSLLYNYKHFAETQSKITKTYDIGKGIQKYTHENGINNYRVDLIPNNHNSNTMNDSKMDRIINKICNALYVNVLESDIKNHKLTICLDEEVLNRYNLRNVPDNETIYIQIYDKSSVFDRIYC